MHDIRSIRDAPAAFDAGLARRGSAPCSATLIALDERRRALLTELQTAQARRNEASKAIGAAKAQKDEAAAAALMAETATFTVMASSAWVLYSARNWRFVPAASLRLRKR